MFRKKWFLTITTLLLLTGAAFAQNDTDDRDSDDDARSECEADRQEAYADADEEYQEERDEAESAEERDEAQREYDEERADADEEYRECLADAREDDDDDDDSESLPVPGNYTGRHVSFRVTDSGIANYTVQDTLIFSHAYVDSPADWDEFEAEGASLELEGADDVEVKISDSSTGVFRFEADDDAHVTIEFPAGYDVETAMRDRAMDDEDDDDEDDDDSDDRDDDREDAMERYADRSGHGHNHLILTGPNNLTAHLYVEDGYSYDNGTLTSPEEVRLVVAGGQGLSERHHERTIEGIANGRIAAEVELRRDGSTRDAEFADVNVSIEETDSGLIAHVDRADLEGRTILFTLEQGALGDLGSLRVLFDGEPIGLADDAEDVLDTSDGVAEYLILVGGDGAEVLVQVPHFSPHTIELQSSMEATTIPGPSGALVMTGILGLAAAVQAVRRR